MSTVLITNDDGIEADGLAALERVARRHFETVWVVAPSQQQSQVGHRVTTGEPIQYQKLAERRFSIDATPADCTRVGL
ncbi:MAG: 5'/3'-nucleotidase SurE, partial [Verrucomicrobiota bacterium]